MTEKERHIEYRKIPLECSFMKPILNEEDYKLLRKYGTWMNALFDKSIKPITNEQRNFCKSIISKSPPSEKYALIFWKYINRKKLLKTNVLNNQKITLKDDREDWKKIRKMKF